MGRYHNQIITTDKAEKLEEWVQTLAKETNRRLNSSELYAVSLNFREPFELSGKKHNNGFVSMHIEFACEAPNFLTSEDKNSWYSRIIELAGKRFLLNTALGGLTYANIDFEEPSEEELYILTPKKETTIREGSIESNGMLNGIILR